MTTQTLEKPIILPVKMSRELRGKLRQLAAAHDMAMGTYVRVLIENALQPGGRGRPPKQEVSSEKKITET